MPNTKDTVHRLFSISILLKGLDGALEIIGGVVFFFLDPGTLNAVIVFMTAHELSEDPQDLIANVLRRSVQSFSPDTQMFASAYLVGHGVIKVFLVAGLLREKLWAFPTALHFMGIFILYQLYRFAHTHSLGLLSLTIMDVIIVGLIWREYQFRNAARLTVDAPDG